MKINRIVLCILMILTVAFGASLTLKAAVGVGAWDALAATGSSMTGIQVGTMGMFFNLLCVLVEFVLLRKDFKIKHILQIPLCFLLGYAVNFFFYEVLGGFEISQYWLRIVILVIGFSVCALAVGVIMLIDVVTFTLEGACKAITDKIHVPFHTFRQGVDVVCIVVVLFVSFTFDVPLSIREGTVIGMILFGPLMGLFMKKLKPMLLQFDLMDEK